MELAFIWIKEYGPLDRLGINFNNSSDSLFEYDGKELLIKSKQRNKLNFGDKITGITIIAGQNGSGKTSLCEAVLYSTATIQEGMFGFELPFDGIVCYGNHIFYHIDLIIKNIEDLKSAGYKVKSFNDSPFEDINWGIKKEFTSGGFIYYSNSFDFRTAFRGVNLVNISSSNCLVEAHRYSSYPVNELRKDKTNDIAKFRVLESNRILDFFIEDIVKPPFEYPKSFILLSTYTGNNRFLKDEEKYEFYGELEGVIFNQLCYKNYSSHHRTLEINIDWKTISNLIHQLYKLNILRAIHDGYNFSADQVRAIVFENIKSSSLNQLRTTLGNKILTLFKFHDHFLKGSMPIESDKFTPYSMQQMYNNQYADWRFVLLERVYLEFHEKNRNLLKRFLSLENELLNGDETSIKRISNFSLPNFYSSGELSYLSLFSRLNQVIKNYSNGRDNKKSIILFIDEGDVGYHPSWSKKFLKWLTDFINSNKEGFSFQLVISTHSPYLLSDVHNENLLLLKRENIKSTEIVDSSKLLPFGANIYDLLADGFFLNDGAIGEFAKGKINFAIDNINQWIDLKKDGINKDNSDLIYDHGNEIFEIINLIGDNLVRNKLLELYSQIFEDKFKINKEIEYLESRLAKLKKENI